MYTSYTIQQQIYQGSGCIQAIPDILKKENWKKVLIVCGPTLLKSGTIKIFEDLLDKAGCTYKIFSDVKPNPMCRDVEEIGLPMYREMEADVMLAVGGGSTLDSAKGIAIIGDSDKTIFDIAGTFGKYPPHEPLPWKTYPIIAVPTTCGTGSEVIKNAVLSEDNEHKLVPMHDCIIPAYAICDPDFLATLPHNVAAATAMDAFVQAVEGTVSRAANDFARLTGFGAIDLIGSVIRDYCKDPADPKLADAMSRGCIYAGLCWNNSFPAQNHGSNHPLTELLHIAHGDSCAIIMPWFIKQNGSACKSDFYHVYKVICQGDIVSEDEFTTDMLVKEWEKLNADIGISGYQQFKDRGATDEILRKIADAFNGNSPNYPVATTREDLYQALLDIRDGKYEYSE